MCKCVCMLHSELLKNTQVEKYTENKNKYSLLTLTKDFKAHIAHFVPTQSLPDCKKNCKCRNIHGHSVKITTKITGIIDDKTRMVIDYTILKNVFGSFVDEYIDHRFILPLELLEQKYGSAVNYLSTLIRFQHFLEESYLSEPVEDVIKVLTYTKENGFEEHAYTLDDTIYHENSDIIAILYKSFSILNTPSTTAEDMAMFLTRVLKLFLKETNFLDRIEEVGIVFCETDTSSVEYAESI